MILVCYETSRGFGSVAEVLEHDEGWVRIRDFVFGERVIDPLQTMHVIQAPSGLVLPFHHFGTAQFLRIAANPPATRSGYPVAWERVRRWRERVAPRWQTVALVGVFTALTIRESYEQAEEVFEDIGPTLRGLMRAQIVPSRRTIRSVLIEAGHRALLGRRSESISEVISYSAELSPRLRRDPDYGRGFRNRAALETRLPVGIGLAKLSFWVSLLGRDAACIDMPILRSWFGLEAESLAERFQKARTGRRRVRVTERQVVDYNALEELLRHEPGIWDPKWPMPYARAQWLLWERVVGDVAAHETLFRIIGR